MFFKGVYLPLFGVWFILFGIQIRGAEIPKENIKTDVPKQSTQPQTSTDARNRRETAMKEVRETIEKFKREYERQHHVTNVVCELDEVPQTFEGNASFFTSEILKLKFKYESETGDTLLSSVMIKVPQMGLMYDHGVQMLFYAKEKFIYEEVLPLMYKNSPFDKLVPNFYVSTDSGILVLENLQESGFRGWRKGTLLEFAECDAVWKSLAQFHALSTPHLDRISDRLDSLTTKDLSKGEWSEKVIPSVIGRLRKLVLPLVFKSTDINAKFDNMLNDINSVIDLEFQPNKNGLNVLLHGDAHVSNIIFCPDAAGNSGLRFRYVDFQQSRRGSPVIDLMHFTVFSVQPEAFFAHRDTLFNNYIFEFNRTLEILELPNKNLYTLEDLKADFQKYIGLYFCWICGDIPATWAGDTSCDSSGDVECAVDTILKSDKYIQAFEIWVKHLLL